MTVEQSTAETIFSEANAIADSLCPSFLCRTLIASTEAHKVSDVAGRTQAEATRDRAVVRLGEATAASGASSRFTLLRT
jgi:hypothetical protein